MTATATVSVDVVDASVFFSRFGVDVAYILPSLVVGSFRSSECPRPRREFWSRRELVGFSCLCFFGLIIALSDSILWRHSLSIVLRCFGFPDNNLIMAAQQNDGVPREGPGLDWHPRRTKKYGAWVRIHSRWPTTVCDDSSIKERQIDPWLLFSSVSCT